MTMEDIYYDPGHPAGFGGVRRLEQAAVAAGKQRKAVPRWLMGQRVYTLHKAARKRYVTRPYKAAGPHMLWQADLVEMIPYADENDNYRYLLTVIDIFSR